MHSLPVGKGLSSFKDCPVVFPDNNLIDYDVLNLCFYMDSYTQLSIRGVWEF